MKSDEDKNVFGQYLSWCTYHEGMDAISTPTKAAKSALALFEMDQAVGRQRFIISGHGHGDEYLAYLDFLKARGFEIHMGGSDEEFGHEQVFNTLYNTLSFASVRHGSWLLSFANWQYMIDWKAKSGVDSVNMVLLTENDEDTDVA